MGHTRNNHTPAARGCPMMPPAHRARVLIGIVVLTSLGLLSGCGQAAARSPVATPSPTQAPPTATATATPTPTAAPTSASASGACQPDNYGIYSDQTGYVTDLTDYPLPAPPQTKHGIGSTGVNGSVTQGGESGMCTIGTFASVTAFYTQQLPSLGWQYSAPPEALYACFHGSVPAQVWWKASDTFSWSDGGDAGAGSIFWSYTFCSVHS